MKNVSDKKSHENSKHAFYIQERFSDKYAVI